LVGSVVLDAFRAEVVATPALGAASGAFVFSFAFALAEALAGAFTDACRTSSRCVCTSASFAGFLLLLAGVAFAAALAVVTDLRGRALAPV
ncbi:MAG: hypothetical protein EB091_10860, partial [Betaproteobacteria bacterium]|nr:hypothetical protein [Betaproteobacteria bacterium]